jgi:phage terminase large subunit-like protein
MTDTMWVFAVVRELAALEGEAQLFWVLRRMTVPQLRALQEAWPVWAHDGQMPPEDEWRIWLMMAGRGSARR